MAVKTPALWTPETSGTVASTNSGVVRKLQNGTVRLEQDGTTRILQPDVITLKVPATWSETA